jgi:hypothetical protein
MDIMKMGYEDGGWIKLAQNFVQQRVSVVAMLKLGAITGQLHISTNKIYIWNKYTYYEHR